MRVTTHLNKDIEPLCIDGVEPEHAQQVLPHVDLAVKSTTSSGPRAVASFEVHDVDTCSNCLRRTVRPIPGSPARGERAIPLGAHRGLANEQVTRLIHFQGVFPWA